MVKGGYRMSSDIIYLPGEFYSKVKNKEKTMVIRPASDRLKIRERDWVPIVFNGTDDNVMVEIDNITFKLFKDLTDKHARKCGYDDVKELKHNLLERYVTLDNGSRLYLYDFIIVAVSEKVGE